MSFLCPRHWSLKQRLDHRSIRDPKTGCILWTGSRTTNGYGGLNYRGRHLQAHRASWLAHRGPIPAGLLVCHRCDVRPCINPDHLFLGTQKQNMADKVAKQGHADGRRAGAPAEQGAGNHAHRNARPRVRHAGVGDPSLASWRHEGRNGHWSFPETPRSTRAAVLRAQEAMAEDFSQEGAHHRLSR